MNFYQRANLSMCLAVILGMELSLSNWIDSGGEDLDLSLAGNVNFYCWLAFQFMFRIKMTIDDNKYFQDLPGKPLSDSRLLWDFILFIVSNFLFIMSAVFIVKPEISYWFFIAGIVFTTVWVLLNDTNKSVSKWLVLNAGYLLCILAMHYQLDYGIYLPQIALFVLLGLDYKISGTAKNMPRGTET